MGFWSAEIRKMQICLLKIKNLILEKLGSSELEHNAIRNRGEGRDHELPERREKGTRHLPFRSAILFPDFVWRVC